MQTMLFMYQLARYAINVSWPNSEHIFHEMVSAPKYLEQTKPWRHGRN